MERSIEQPQPRNESTRLLADKTAGSWRALAPPSRYGIGLDLTATVRGSDR
jgi:hypothetical protein